jgi:ABC-type ATPase with predicted acetyltransferase domain
MIVHDFDSDFLPGSIHFATGSSRDYRTLERFHYLPRRPATWASVWCAWYVPRVAPPVLAGVAVLSHPPAVHRLRHRTFELDNRSYGEKLRWANAHMRTISRVIVHPQFRSLGLARRLIRCCIEGSSTRYVEAAARMGIAHPMFTAAGMIRVTGEANEPLYFWIDRNASPTH